MRLVDAHVPKTIGTADPTSRFERGLHSPGDRPLAFELRGSRLMQATPIGGDPVVGCSSHAAYDKLPSGTDEVKNKYALLLLPNPAPSMSSRLENDLRRLLAVLPGRPPFPQRLVARDCPTAGHCQMPGTVLANHEKPTACPSLRFRWTTPLHVHPQDRSCL